MKKRFHNGKPRMGKPKLRVIGGGQRKKPEFTPAEKSYFAELHRFIDRIYEMAASEYDWTWCQLAAHAELGYGTVVNLGERRTLYPRYFTVFKLAKAVGLALELKAMPRKPAAATAGKIKVIA